MLLLKPQLLLLLLLLLPLMLSTNWLLRLPGRLPLQRLCRMLLFQKPISHSSGVEVKLAQHWLLVL